MVGSYLFNHLEYAQSILFADASKVNTGCVFAFLICMMVVYCVWIPWLSFIKDLAFTAPPSLSSLLQPDLLNFKKGWMIKLEENGQVA